jgi:hypothetical protein
MPRPFTDISGIIPTNPVKNGAAVVTTTFAGRHSLIGTYASSGTSGTTIDSFNTYIKNTPTITDIASKYGNRFHNGIFVVISGS